MRSKASSRVLKKEGVPGLTSYLASIEMGKDGKPPPMNVLRWWFTLNYDALSATAARDAPIAAPSASTARGADPG